MPGCKVYIRLFRLILLDFYKHHCNNLLLGYSTIATTTMVAEAQAAKLHFITIASPDLNVNCRSVLHEDEEEACTSFVAGAVRLICNVF